MLRETHYLKTSNLTLVISLAASIALTVILERI
jgi:hypothetical protein